NALGRHLESLAGEQDHYGDPVEVVLETANSLWGQADLTWVESFLDALARDYGTGVHAVDYRSAHEEARQAINAWTADQTRDKIPELIGSGVLSAATRLVLVNALYLKAPWLVPFDKDATEDRPFQRRDGS